MNDQQILSVIKDYIQNRSINQALMITGEWGCGKSYFVKNSVKECRKGQEMRKQNAGRKQTDRSRNNGKIGSGK